eukprot:15611221-Heterocapsa_arctica.AAC.1
MQTGVKQPEPPAPKRAPAPREGKAQRWCDTGSEPDIEKEKDINVDSSNIHYARAFYKIDNQDWRDDASGELLVNMTIVQLME